MLTVGKDQEGGRKGRRGGGGKRRREVDITRGQGDGAILASVEYTIPVKKKFRGGESFLVAPFIVWRLDMGLASFFQLSSFAF